MTAVVLGGAFTLAGGPTTEESVKDLVSLALVLSFLVACLGYIELCSRLRGKDEL